PPRSPPCPYTTLFRSLRRSALVPHHLLSGPRRQDRAPEPSRTDGRDPAREEASGRVHPVRGRRTRLQARREHQTRARRRALLLRSEEHTSELQYLAYL